MCEALQHESHTLTAPLSQQRKGQVLQIHRGIYCWLHSREITESQGVFVVRCNNLGSVDPRSDAGTSAALDLTRMNPAMSQPIPKSGIVTANLRHLINTRVVITKGTQKGLIGIIKDMNGEKARIELIASNKVVDQPIANLKRKEYVFSAIPQQLQLTISLQRERHVFPPRPNARRSSTPAKRSLWQYGPSKQYHTDAGHGWRKPVPERRWRDTRRWSRIRNDPEPVRIRGWWPYARAQLRDDAQSLRKRGGTDAWPRCWRRNTCGCAGRPDSCSGFGRCDAICQLRRVVELVRVWVG